ncbi:sorting nexin [Thraustotheca clavata]|uniref:Sorting nexin n=1 Tax=Thraustotheca clavata TaxID=74557 RepID=A0A1V9Z5R4_9STRA|nr:sorting nexin [Thraustotheca clavata]
MSNKWVNVDYTDPMGRTGSSRVSRNTGEPIQIDVGEPVKQGEGMQAYISYKITTNTERRQFKMPQFSVIRRFSDFVWLHGSLCSLYPGVIVPPLPEKLLVGRFSPEFVESRRRALQVFLSRCAVHPEIQNSEYFTVFLEAQDDALQHFKQEALTKSKAKHAGSGMGLFQWFDDTIVATISSTLGAQSLAVEKLKTNADIQVEDISAYIDALEPIIQGLAKHAHGLTKRAREIADGLFEFGVALTLLGQAEENQSLQTALCHVGTCSDKLSVLAAEHAEKELMLFEEPILDYIRLVQSVKAALIKRNEVRNQYHATVMDLEAKQTALQKAHSKSGAVNTEKIDAAEADVTKAQLRVDEAKLEHDVVTERVLREVDRFKHEKLNDFKRIVLDYIELQIQYNRKVEDEWGAVIPKLQLIQIESPGKPAVGTPPPPPPPFNAPSSTTDVAL